MKERSSSSALMARSATAAGSGSRVANDPEDTLGATSSTHAGAPLSVAGPSQAQDECPSPVSTTTPPWPPTAPTSSSRAAGYPSPLSGFSPSPSPTRKPSTSIQRPMAVLGHGSRRPEEERVR